MKVSFIFGRRIWARTQTTKRTPLTVPKLTCHEEPSPRWLLSRPPCPAGHDWRFPVHSCEKSSPSQRPIPFSPGCNESLPDRGLNRDLRRPRLRPPPKHSLQLSAWICLRKGLLTSSAFLWPWLWAPILPGRPLPLGTPAKFGESDQYYRVKD